MPDPARKSIMSDAVSINEAKEAAIKNTRSLRRVLDLANRDMVVYEDRTSGERRSVPNKLLLSLGTPTAFELSEPTAGSPHIE
jgi:hypothetical protein